MIASSSERGDEVVTVVGRPVRNEEQRDDPDAGKVGRVHTLRQVDFGRTGEDDVERAVRAIWRIGVVGPAVPIGFHDGEHLVAPVHQRHVGADERDEVSERQRRQPIEFLLLPFATVHRPVLADTDDR